MGAKSKIIYFTKLFDNLRNYKIERSNVSNQLKEVGK